jgi:hypothetical protein
MSKIDISHEVISAAITIHRKLGPGLKVRKGRKELFSYLRDIPPNVPFFLALFAIPLRSLR